MEEDGDEGGGEEFGVGGALVCGEEGVGVDEVEDGGEERRGWRGEAAGESMEGEAGGGEDEPGIEDGRPCPLEDEAEDGSDHPGERWVEDEAGLAGVPGGGVCPVEEEVAVGELAGGFKPIEDVEVEVVAAGAAVEDEREDSDERGDRDEQVVEAVALHGVEGIVFWLVVEGTGKSKNEMRGSLRYGGKSAAFGRDDGSLGVGE